MKDLLFKYIYTRCDKDPIIIMSRGERGMNTGRLNVFLHEIHSSLEPEDFHLFRVSIEDIEVLSQYVQPGIRVFE